MRPLEEMAVATPETVVLDVLKELTAKRVGAALVVDAQGYLAGIFTHGDFIRRFTSDSSVGQRHVGELMTAAPITIDADKLAAEVLVILEQHRIDDLAVIDTDGKAVGLVDSQDLSRLRIL